jgi:DNA polymerase III sliding clamp (beta) subunit (PCNA family)
MDVTNLNASEWQAALDRISRAGEVDREAISISSFVRLRTCSDKLELLACDEIVAARTYTSANIEAKGGCCVAIRSLANVLECAPSQIAMQLNRNGKLSFFSPGTRWTRTVPTRSFDEMRKFPALPPKLYRLPLADMYALIKCTAHAVNTSHADRGIVIRRGPDYLEALAADTYRAARARVKFNGELPELLGIPHRALREILKAMRMETAENIETGQSANHVFFRLPTTTIACSRLQCEPPDVSMCFGVEPRASCLLDRERLIKVLENARQVTDQPDARLRITLSGIEISAESVNGEGRAACDEIVGECNGPCGHVDLNGKYLEDAARAIDGEKIKLRMDGPRDSLLVEPGGDVDVKIVIPPKLMVE